MNDKNVKWGDCVGMGTSGRGEGERETNLIKILYMYENRVMKSVKNYHNRGGKE
jgi:hypothetical protein